MAEPGLDRDPARRQRVAHRGPEVERAAAAVPALAGQAHGQLAGQGLEGAVQRGQLVRVACMTSMSSGSGLRTELGQRLGAPVLDQAAADLVLDRLAELGLDALPRYSSPRQPLVERGQAVGARRPSGAPTSRSRTPSSSRFRSVR